MLLLKRRAQMLNTPPTRRPPVLARDSHKSAILQNLIVHLAPQRPMNNPDSYSNKDNIASATWSDPLWAMGDYLYPYLSVPQSTHPDPVSAPEYPSTARSYVPDFNAANDAAFSLAPTIEMGAFSNLPTQVNSTNPVSDKVLECRHRLTLLCHRMVLILGSCWPYVCSFLASATILRIHRMRIQSRLQCEFRGLPAATGWRPVFDRVCSPCHQLGVHNT